jgi:succinyl-CoA synthetase beta subunit
MNLHEYQAKSIFNNYGIPIPRGRVASTAMEARQISEELGGRVVVKAQVQSGGRGKSGGIRLVNTPEEAEDVATKMLSMDINGLPVHKVLIDEMVTFSREMYLSVSVDRTEKQHVILSSKSGGINIENIIKERPQSLHHFRIDQLLGLQEFKIREVATTLDIPKELWTFFIRICLGLFKSYCENDATLAEINPLVLTDDNTLIALDGKLTIDDNALFRHPQFTDLSDIEARYLPEAQARKYGISFIGFDGNIGCMVNGAGLALATMDLIQLFGGRPANFMDIGGGAGIEKVTAGFKSILSSPDIRSVLINIFGGITRCDVVAKGIVAAIEDIQPNIPIITRLVGTNMMEGSRILKGKKLIQANTLVEAVQKAVVSAKG